MLRVVLVLLAVAATASAQPAKIQTAPAEKPTPSNAPKKLPATLPTPTPAPEAARPSASPSNRTPDEIVDQFFAGLKEDRVDAAYETLDREFAMVDRGDQSRSIREQTQKALDAYGPVTGSELVREEKLGASLMRRTYILTGQQLPLRWRFYFYKPADRWTLIDLRIDDAIADWFNEAAAPGAQP